MQQDHRSVDPETALAHQRPGRRAVELQVPSQEFGAADPGCTNAGGGWSEGWRHPAPAAGNYGRLKMTPPSPVRIGEEEVHEDRYSRFRLIPWWDQSKLKSARVLVIGAGALGNEILKNLVLLGFERMVLADLDRIEESNLSRTILYRSSDVGSYKAEVAARSVRALAPHARIKPLVANVVQDCGLGLFAWSDVTIA